MPSTSISLLKRARDPSDEKAWQRLVHLYSPLLKIWARDQGLSENEAADLTQEILLVLVRELPKFEYDSAKGKFRYWLKTVTENKCREFHRRKRKLDSKTRSLVEADCSISDPPDQSFWDESYSHLLMTRAMQVMKSEFEEKTWKAAWEFTTSGKSAAEVGKMLGISEAAVYVAKSRVLKRLRIELQDLLD